MPVHDIKENSLSSKEQCIQWEPEQVILTRRASSSRLLWLVPVAEAVAAVPEAAAAVPEAVAAVPEAVAGVVV